LANIRDHIIDRKRIMELVLVIFGGLILATAQN